MFEGIFDFFSGIFLIFEVIKMVIGVIGQVIQAIAKAFASIILVIVKVFPILVILALTAVVSKARRHFFEYLEEKSQKKESLWNALVTAIQAPVALIVWIVGVSFVLEYIHWKINGEILAAVPIIGFIATIAALAWFVIRLVEKFEKTYIQKKTARGEPYNQANLDALANVLRLVIVITAALVAMLILGFSIAVILALGVVGGIAVGFAAKELISNFLKR